MKIATTWVTIKEILVSKRFKSFYWRASAMVVAGLIQVIIDSATDLQLNGYITVILGLILAEITKKLNTK
jgi:hypothetical protein